MVITLEPELESAVNDLAREKGVAPEALALDALRERFLSRVQPIEPRDEWERSLRALARDCGVSLSNEALSREEMYE